MAIGKFKNITKKVITSTTVSEYSNGMITNKRALSAKCLNLIQRQKRFVLTLDNILKIKQVNGLYLTNLDSNDINKDFAQIDIKNCYPSIAIDNGLTTQDIFDELNTLPKEERLVVLGAVSSAKTERVFIKARSSGVLDFETRHKPATNEYYFFNLMNILSEINKLVLKKLSNLGVKKYLIYCDALFIKQNDYERIKKSVGSLEDYINKSLTPTVNYEFEGFYQLKNIGSERKILTFSQHIGKATTSYSFLNNDTGEVKILNV